jgi:hypothetical protein
MSQYGLLYHISFFGFCLAVLFSIALTLGPNPSEKRKKVALGLLLVAVFLFHSFYPSLFDQAYLVYQEEKKYRNSQLKNVDYTGWDPRLENLFFIEKKSVRFDKFGRPKVSKMIG